MRQTTLSDDESAAPSKSPLLHAIHILTSDPILLAVRGDETADQLGGRHPVASVAHSSAACAAGFAGAALLLAVTKVIADKSPEMRGQFQEKWARLETSISGLCACGAKRSALAGQAMKGYVQRHEEELRTAGKQAFKVLLVGMFLLAVKTRPQILLKPAKVLLSPSSVAASAACIALLSHKPALGVRDPYKRVRSQVTAASGAATRR